MPDSLRGERGVNDEEAGEEFPGAAVEEDGRDGGLARGWSLAAAAIHGRRRFTPEDPELEVDSGSFPEFRRWRPVGRE